MREAILNAIVHKQYEFGVPISNSVYKDKTVILGKLNWTKTIYTKH